MFENQNQNLNQEAARAVAFIIAGLGLAGLAIWLSPVALGDVLTLCIPMFVFAAIVMGTGIAGKGVLLALKRGEVSPVAVQQELRKMEGQGPTPGPGKVVQPPPAQPRPAYHMPA